VEVQQHEGLRTDAQQCRGEPKGKLIKTADGKTDAYLATAASDVAKEGCGILYVADIFGIWQNSKLLADNYAAQGYTTLVVDLFNGDQLPLEFPPNFNIMDWIQNGTGGQNPHTPAAIDPVIVSGIETLRQQGVNKVGAVGYCFGAKYVVRHYKDGIDVGFTAHPSFVEEEELAAITGPLSIAAAEVDEIFPAEKRYKSEEILSKIKVPFQINLFSGTSHGFAVRADLSKKEQKWAKERAFFQAVDWFDEHLAGGDKSRL
jgi:dienelactone hydrolase